MHQLFFLFLLCLIVDTFKCQRQLHTCFIINNAGNFGIPVFFSSRKNKSFFTWTNYLV